MEIIDAQIHDVKPLVSWDFEPAEEDAIDLSSELALASMDAVGVDRAVVNSSRAIVSGYVARQPDRFAGVPFFGPVPAPDGVNDYIATLRAAPGIVGVRFLFASAAEAAQADQLRAAMPELRDLHVFSIDELRAGVCDPYFDAAERHELPVFVLAQGFVSDLQPTVKSHPDLRVILDHLGLHTPPRRQPGPELFADIPSVVDLAQFPNVAVKLTGAPSLSLRPFPYEDLWPHLGQIIDAFGLERLMWGSDFTRCRGLHTYRESVEFVLFSDELSLADKQMLFSGSIRRWLRWPPEGG